jgi:porin
MTIRLVCTVLLLGSAAMGQETQPPAASQPAPETTQPAAMPSLIQELPDYSGDWLSRKYLTGDWGGARTHLAQHGILFDVDVTQIMQGNAHGGKDTNNAFRYSGSTEFKLQFDTARMGLWPGGLITLRGETMFGQSINQKTGAIHVPNSDALFPLSDEGGKTTLSEYYLMQALSEKFVLLAGKIDATRLVDQNEFACNERTQFMNLGLRLNPMAFPFAPYTTLGAGAVWLPTKWLTIMSAVVDNDPEGAVTKTGFNTAFHDRNFYTVAQEYDFTVKPFGKTGHQRLGWLWTARDLTLLDQDPRLPLPLTLTMRVARPRLERIPGPARAIGRALGLSQSLGDVEQNTDDWMFYYNFDQYVYTEPGDEKQGVGVFGRFGWSSGESNPIEQFYSIGVGGKGVIPERDNDTFGVGYYHANLSDDLPSSLGVHSEQGVEAYYNIEITPWLHITPDLQIIVNPGGGFGDRDVAIVYGLRTQMSF